jgi:hypothetical protein
MRKGTAHRTEAGRIASVIRKALPNVKGGTLRFWGSWFGRPMDNFHQVVSCGFRGDVLVVHFDEREVLRVWDPRKATIDEKTFQIMDATRVRWQWFYYGRRKVPKNLYFEDFTKGETRITVETNVDWYTPRFYTNRTMPAVEIA